MRIVTFNEIVPGMVLRPFEDVNSDTTDKHGGKEMIIVMEVIPEGSDVFWNGSRALKYIESYDAYHGASFSAWRTADTDRWEVIEDQEVLDALRATVKAAINKNRDHLTECERFVDANL